MEKKILTKRECLERLKELFDLLQLDETLTAEQSDMVDSNFGVLKFFIDLQECKDFAEVGRIGFGSDEDEEDEEDEDEEDSEDE